uniref:Metalloendopeptidase n=1 Tax=Caenorhabditis japonica TaxID=281687 RepID=A0A8R1I1L1_CAEJA
MDLGHVIGNIAANIGERFGLNDADVVGDLRRGELPQFADIPTIINQVLFNAGDLLPRVPRLNINDPLVGLNTELVGFIKNLQSQFGQLDSRQRSSIQNSCRSFKCDQQSVQNTQAKQELFSKMLAFDESVGGGKGSPDRVNLRFDRTQQVKQAMLKRANLSHIIVPADNGVFDRDVLLTEHQANFLLNELGEAGVGADVAGGAGNRRSPRSGLYFQENPVQKWDIWHPIQYTLDDSLEEADKQVIREALHEISINSCILFKYNNTTPQGYHLNYMKVDSPTFCGLSYIGRTDPANPIYLSFQCDDSRGVAMHETMHALGVSHQHLRLDRDKHIKIDWSNIDPQHYDTFAIADAKLYTSYGTKYAYDSIMHYNAYLAARDPSKPTMIPLVSPQENLPKMGQRAKLTRADIRLLKKMYCRPGCDDSNVHCGTWALNGYCKHKDHNKWMTDNCKASCDKC